MAASPRPRITVPDTPAPADGHAVRVVADGTPVAIFNQGGQFYAVGAACTHVGGPLDKGTVSGQSVRCPLHGSKFNLETGQVEQGPARTPVPAYRVYRTSTGFELEPR
jgi:nitrite reductase/ring-hydroxylating ferredoxin subunit